MDKYEKELQRLKPHDEVQFSEQWQGFQFITTAGHGYLVVPKDPDGFPCLASSVMDACGNYGYIGDLAFYLEEDSEAPMFLKRVKELTTA